MHAQTNLAKKQGRTEKTNEQNTNIQTEENDDKKEDIVKQANMKWWRRNKIGETSYDFLFKRRRRREDGRTHSHLCYIAKVTN